MLEFMIIFCYITSVRYWKLRGKSFEELTFEQKNMVLKELSKDFWRRNKCTPEQYHLKLQKSAIALLVIAIVFTILWFVLLFTLYPMLFTM